MARLSSRLGGIARRLAGDQDRLPHRILLGFAVIYAALPGAGLLLGFPFWPADPLLLATAALSAAVALLGLGWSVVTASRGFGPVLLLCIALGAFHFSGWRMWGYSSLLYLVSVIHFSRQLAPPLAYRAVMLLLASWGIAGTARFTLVEEILRSDLGRIAGEAVVLSAISMVTLVLAATERKLLETGHALRRRNEQLAAVARVGNEIVSTLELPRIFETICEQACRLFPTEAFFVAVRGPGPDQISYELVMDHGKRYERHVRELDDGLSATIVRTGKPVLVRNLALERDSLPPVRVSGEMPLSWMGAPMAIGDQVLGLISVQCYRAEAFDEDDLSLLGLLANWAATAIESARAHDLQKEAGEATALRELNAMKSRLLSTLSHELRTPLSFVQAGSELLMYRRFEPEKLREVAGLVNDGAVRLAGVVDDIIEYADLESGAAPSIPAPANPVALVREAIDEAAGPARADRVLLETPEPVPTVAVDGFRLRSMAGRLVRNALKFSPEISTVRVRVAVEESTLRVEVHDSGFGIPPEDLDRVFEPFFRGEVSRTRCIGGTGLGLAIVKRLVDLMGGEIVVRSEVDRGTEVVVSVPIERA